MKGVRNGLFPLKGVESAHEFPLTSPCFDIAVNRSYEWVVNGRKVTDDVQEFLEDQTAFEIENWGEPICPQCRNPFGDKAFHDLAEDNEVWHNNRSYVFSRCGYCAHWEFKGFEGGNKCMDSQEAVLLSAITARFTKDFPDECSKELTQHLRRNPLYWHEMNPKRLEKLVADVFRANYHHAEAIHVGKPFDQGVDVIFIESNGTRWLVQVKRREQPARPEGFATLQSILGAMALDGSRHGIVVSTADSFSYYAHRARRHAEQQGFVVQFIDKGVLNRMVTPLLPQTPWREIFSRPELSQVAEDVQQHFWRPGDDDQLVFESLLA